MPPIEVNEKIKNEPEILEPKPEVVPEQEWLNPDIDRPSPPRAGASRLFENPFDLTDEDSAPVEPKKLSPSHVFESTSLEDSLLLLEAENVTVASPLSERAASLASASSA